MKAGRYVQIGWGDESGSIHALDPGTYILAAAIADETDVPKIRSTMQGLLLSGQRKVHWRDESDGRREEISSVVATLPISGLVVVRSNKPDDLPERRRRKCMERLLWELGGCDQLIMESRGPADDKRDRVHFDQMRRRHSVPKGLHTDHVAGVKDSGLWVADALCGAITRERVGDPSYLQMISSSITVRIEEID